MSGCVFCSIAEKKLSSDIIFENKDIMAFRDIAPQAPTHIIVIPKKHVDRLENVEDKDIIVQVFDAIGKITGDDKFGPMNKDGYRVMVNSGESAGQSVFHLHFHILAGKKF